MNYIHGAHRPSADLKIANLFFFYYNYYFFIFFSILGLLNIKTNDFDVNERVDEHVEIKSL